MSQHLYYIRHLSTWCLKLQGFYENEFGLTLIFSWTKKKKRKKNKRCHPLLPLWNRSFTLFILVVPCCCNMLLYEWSSLQHSHLELCMACIKDLTSGFVTFYSISLSVPCLMDTKTTIVCTWSCLINALLMSLGHMSSPVAKLTISNNFFVIDNYMQDLSFLCCFSCLLKQI